MTAFRAGRRRSASTATIDAAARRRCSPAIGSGAARATPPTIAIVDWRDVPTWTEFEILRDAFIAAGVPTVVCDPRELTFENGVLHARRARGSISSIAACCINDIVARPDECAALVEAYAARAVCVANTFRCKLPHKKAFFAVLTDPANASLFSRRRARRSSARTCRGRGVRRRRRDGAGRPPAALLELARREREHLVLKPNDEYGGTGVHARLGDDDGRSGTPALDSGARTIRRARGSCRSASRCGARCFRSSMQPAAVTMRDMLVDFAPYLFRGRMGGYLTRLSATGLANVTSGGGQVPAFVVSH